MKRWFVWVAPLLLAGLLLGCGPQGQTPPQDTPQEPAEEQSSFYAVVVELLDDGVIVEPREGEAIRASADRVAFRTDYLAQIGAEVGDVIWVRYDGIVRETYPAGIDALEWRLEGKGAALG